MGSYIRRNISTISAGIFAIAYFVIAVWTLHSYGLNWDERYHYERGQAMLHFFFTGQTQYPSDFHRQTIFHTYDFIDLTTDPYLNANHPALGGILGALSNFVFHQQLGISPDIESYRYITILLVCVLLFVVFQWTKTTFGLLAAVVASLSLALYPLFWAELHYSVKDVPQTVFFSIAIFLYHEAIVTRRLRYVFLFALAGGLAMSFKYNFVFSAVVFSAWLVYIALLERWRLKLVSSWIGTHRKFLLIWVLVPLVVASVVVVTWPTIWFNPRLLLASVTYYSEIGTAPGTGWNWTAIQYVLFSTPEVILISAVVGVIGGFLLPKKQHYAYMLIFFWFMIPITRASVPGANLYGGVRQLMEFIPALCILSGVGADRIYRFGYAFAKSQRLKNLFKSFFTLVFLCGFSAACISLIRLHPNQGIYFNSLIGGLSGAKDAHISGWGNNLGHIYRQGFHWLNAHAEAGARIVVRKDVWQSSVPEWVRSDLKIDYNYHERTGPRMAGEYYLFAIHEDMLRDWYLDYYISSYLIPVYELKIDTVTLLVIFKNDPSHARYPFATKRITVNDIRVSGPVLTAQFPGSVVWGFTLNKSSSARCDDARVVQYLLHRDVVQKTSHVTVPFAGMSSTAHDMSFFIKPVEIDEMMLFFANEDCLREINSLTLYAYEKE